MKQRKIKALVRSAIIEVAQEILDGLLDSDKELLVDKIETSPPKSELEKPAQESFPFTPPAPEQVVERPHGTQVDPNEWVYVPAKKKVINRHKLSVPPREWPAISKEQRENLLLLDDIRKNPQSPSYRQYGFCTYRRGGIHSVTRTVAEDFPWASVIAHRGRMPTGKKEHTPAHRRALPCICLLYTSPSPRD